MTYDYPENLTLCIDNIRMALDGYRQMQAIIANLERTLQASGR